MPAEQLRRHKSQTGLQQVSKTRDDALYELEHFVERFNQRLTLDNLRLVERYLKFELHILLEFKVSGFDIEFVAHFQRFCGATKASPAYQSHQSSRVGHGIVDCHSGIVIDSHGPELVPRSRSEQQAVFVDVIQLVEMPKRVVPTSVWFESIDTFNRIWPRTLYFSSELGRHVFRGAVCDGEPDVAARSLRGDALSNQLVNQVIESGPKVLEYIASNDGDGRRDLLNSRNVIDMLSRLRIYLLSNSIGLESVKAVEREIEIADVLFGPFDL
jgi:hypothetical protein